MSFDEIMGLMFFMPIVVGMWVGVAALVYWLFFEVEKK